MVRKAGKQLILIILLIFILCLSIVFHGTADTKEDYPVTRVTVILPHTDDGYWNLVAAGIQEKQEEVGDRYNIDISIIMPQLNYNISQMVDILKQQIAAQVDVLVVQGAEDDEFKETLLKAYKQGIKIICVDTDISDFPEHLYVGTDNYAAGKMLGEHLAELTGGTARLAIVSGEPGYSNLEQRLHGLMDVISKYPGIEPGKVKYDKYDGLTVMRLYQELKEEADVMVYLEGTGGITLTSMFQEADDSYEYIVGFDAYEGAKKGVLNGVVKQDTQQMGHLVVTEIANYIEKGAYSSDNIYTDIHWVTAENYGEVIE